MTPIWALVGDSVPLGDCCCVCNFGSGIVRPLPATLVILVVRVEAGIQWIQVSVTDFEMLPAETSPAVLLIPVRGDQTCANTTDR